MQLDNTNFSESNGRLVKEFSVGRQEKKKEIKIAAPEFRVWSPTTLLGQALTSLTTVDRTGNGAFW